MKIFLSSSGTTSRDIAAALHDWIPRVIQNARPFMAAADIDKGKRWDDVIAQQLVQSDYGIICITKYNFAAPWLHFEAGAISRALGKSSVSPLLFDVDASKIDGPFQQFQFTKYSFDLEDASRKEEISNLIRSVNNCQAPDLRLSDDILESEFEIWWPQLKQQFDAIQPKQDKVTHTAYAWLYAIEDLMREQRADGVKAVWWIAPDPYRYILESPQRETIIQSINRGADYTFFVSADQSEPSRNQLLDLGGGRRSAVKLVRIPVGEFGAAAVTDYVIVDPEKNRRVFLDLPLTHRGFWIEVFAKGADGFYDRFSNLKKKYDEASGSVAVASSSQT